MSPLFKSSIDGICGAFNDERTNQLRDPKQCIYNQSKIKLFVASWTMPEGKNCDVNKLSKRQNLVSKHQDKCKTVSFTGATSTFLSSGDIHL